MLATELYTRITGVETPDSETYLAFLRCDLLKRGRDPSDVHQWPQRQLEEQFLLAHGYDAFNHTPVVPEEEVSELHQALEEQRLHKAQHAKVAARLKCAATTVVQSRVSVAGMLALLHPHVTRRTG